MFAHIKFDLLLKLRLEMNHLTQTTSRIKTYKNKKSDICGAGTNHLISPSC